MLGSFPFSKDWHSSEYFCALTLSPLTQPIYISQNRFALPSDTIGLPSAFPNLQELQLNKTLLAWIDFTEYLLPHLPRLINVELGYNRLDHLSDETTRRKHPTTDTELTTVNFDGNSLNDWPEICSSLAKYPTYVLPPPRGASESHRPWIPVVGSVDHLVLSLNSIDSIPPLSKSGEGTDGPTSGGLAHVKSLTLSSNNLRTWADINALANHCPILETLNVTDNPIIEGQSHPHVLFTDHVLTPIVVPQRNTVEPSSWQNYPISSP